MKAAVTEGKGDIKIAGAPLPEAAGYRCLCRIQACASCSGTDVKIIQNKLPFEVPYPGIPGHESVGTVIKKGEKARYVREGDVFLRPAAVYPDEKLGDWFSSWGGYAEYGLVTDVKAFKEDRPGEDLNPYTKFQQQIPAGLEIPPAEASMLITLKEAASFVSNAGAGPGSSALVLGTGPVAKSMCFFLKLSGASPVILAGRREEALEWAGETGADFTVNTLDKDIKNKIMQSSGGRGVDFLLDTTGAPELVISSLEFLKPGGKAAPYATYPGKDVFSGCDAEKFIFTGPSEDLAHDRLLQLVRNKSVGLKMFFTHTLPFEKIQEGFELIKNKTAQKIVFEMEG